MRLAATVLATCLSLISTISFASDSDELEAGRGYTRMFFDDDISPIWKQMTKKMRSAIKSEKALRNFRSQVLTQIGTEIRVVDEQAQLVQGNRVYVRRSLFEKSPQPVVIIWAIDRKDRIAGFFVRPQQEPAATSYLDYETEAELQLPFAGEWFVVWGGREIENNYHVVASDQRFAYDMLIVRDEKTHAGDGSRNEQYFCWGEAILAPGSGTVVEARDDLPDNPPGVMDPDNPPGNHVWIDLGNAEFALLAHLQNASVVVSAGDQVKAGDLVGRCGNSGNTTEPHIHFHLQDKPGFKMGAGKPAFFRNYSANGEAVERGEPALGELVENVATASK